MALLLLSDDPSFVCSALPNPNTGPARLPLAGELLQAARGLWHQQQPSVGRWRGYQPSPTARIPAQPERTSSLVQVARPHKIKTKTTLPRKSGSVFIQIDAAPHDYADLRLMPSCDYTHPTHFILIMTF